MTRLVVVVAVVVLSAATAFAQPGLTPSQTPAQPQPTPEVVDGGKSETTAVVLSLVGSVLPGVVMASGFHKDDGGLIGAGLLGSFVGPSFGHWYAGHYLTPGLGMRAGGAVLFAIGVSSSLQCGWDDSGCSKGDGPILLGLGLYVSGALYDIATAGTAARHWNNSHALTLLPTHLGTGPQATTGLAVGGTF